MSPTPQENPNPTGPMPQPAWWKIALATAIIFAAGVVTGGMVISKWTREHNRNLRLRAQVRPPADAPPPQFLPPPAEWTRRPAPELQLRLEQRRTEFLLRAARELDLRPEQRARIEQIIRESQERIRQLWESVQPEIRRELTETRERIRQELTPEQRRAFERLLRREPAGRAERPPPDPDRRDAPRPAR